MSKSKSRRDFSPAWRTPILLALAVAALIAQDSSDRARRVGSHLACLCGCAHTVATCDMFECSFSNPAKIDIAKKVQAGVSDQAIMDEYIGKYGQKIYRADPNAFGWAVPYLMLLPGFALVWWFLRRYYRPRTAPAAAGPAAVDEPEELAKYRDQIEKDLSHLD